MVPEIMAEISKKQSNNFLMLIFTTRGGADLKVMGTIKSSSSRRFFWRLVKSDQTYGYGNIKCLENSYGRGVIAAAAGGAAGGGVQ